MKELHIDLHVHTNASFDSFDKILVKLKKAQKLGLNVIAITDHNSIDNALKAKEIVSKLNDKITVIVGEEIATDKGEIIGLFLEKCIKPSKLQTVLEDIKSQGGLVYLPHPFKRSKIIESGFIDYIDIIEVWNGRCSYEQNYKALIYALKYNKIMACGSDSHLISELGKCATIVTIGDNKINNELTSIRFIETMNRAFKIKIVGSNRGHVKM